MIPCSKKMKKMHLWDRVDMSWRERHNFQYPLSVHWYCYHWRFLCNFCFLSGYFFRVHKARAVDLEQKEHKEERFVFNPLSPDINMHILLTVLHTFHIIPLGRICSKIKTFYLCWSFHSFSLPVCLIGECYCEEKLDSGHYWGLKG